VEHGAPRGVLVGRIAVVVLAVLLGPVGPVVARGAEPWSGPVEVPGAVAEGLMPLRFAATGTGVLAWTHAPFADPPVPELSASVVQGGLVESGVRLAAPFAAGGLVVYGNNRVVAVGTPGVPSASAPPQGLVVMRGRIGTPLRQTVPLVGPSIHRDLLSLEVNAHGVVAAVVSGCVEERAGRCRHYGVALYRWRDGDTPGRPRLVARRSLGAAAAINARGDVLFAWVRRRAASGPRDVLVRLVPARGRARAPQQLGTATQALRFAVRLTYRRRAAVAWLSQAGGEGGFAGPGETRLALAGRTTRFGRARLLERLSVTGPGLSVLFAGVSVELFGKQGGLVAWTGVSEARWLVRAADVHGTRLGAAQVVSDAATDAQLGALAIEPSGRAVIAMPDGFAGSNPTGPPRTLAAIRPTGAPRFLGPEVVATDGGGGIAMTAAIDPVTHRPCVAMFTAGLPYRLLFASRAPIGS
jgi:hypothetical protein